MRTPPDRPERPGMPAYSGPSTRRREPIAGGKTTADLVDSDANERAADALLSARSIPFVLERPALGWRGVPRRILVTVPADRFAEVSQIFETAIEAGVLERAGGMEGLEWY